MYGSISNTYPRAIKSGQPTPLEDIVDVRELSNAQTSEYVYFECQQFNNTTLDQPAKFVETRSNPIVKKGSEYKLSIIRLETSIVSVSMFNSDDVELKIAYYYEPDNILISKIVDLGIDQEIYNIDYVISAINVTLADAFNDFKSAYNAIYGINAWENNVNLAQKPFGTKYNQDQKLLTVYADTLNYSSNPNAVQLIFTRDMINFFSGNVFNKITDNLLPNSLSLFFDVGFYNSNIVNLGLPGVVPSYDTEFIANIASYDTAQLWYNIKQIVIISNKIGIRFLNVSLSYDVIATIYRNVVLDFDYIIDNSDNSPGTRVNYLSNNNRWLDIENDGPINQIDFEIFYRRKNDTLIPLKLRPGDSFSILCLFAKTLTT